jgi:Ca-activated chloride channel homolog
MKSRLLLFLLMYSQVSLATTNVVDIWKNNQAVDHIQKKQVLEAHEDFLQLLSKEPFHPIYQFNLATSFFATEDLDKSIKMYNELKKLDPLPPTVSFALYYNLGVLYGLSKDIDKALENYQKALEFNPDSKEVKTNIELLFKGGKGGGKGDKQDKEQKEKGDKEDEQQKEPQEFSNKNQNQQPDQFNGKDMSKNDVNKILDELKKQEQKIRAQHERKGNKEADHEKAW